MGDGLLTVNLGDDLTAKAISLGVNYTCVILNTNNLKCWGDNKYGQLGYDDTYTRGAHDDTMGIYLPPIVFLGMLTSTPTSTATKSSTPTKTATSTKTSTPTKTYTRTATSTRTATRTP
jgi:alpha-tubulin suppressor-like RCC1 family protein